MDSLQLAEFNDAFSFVLPDFLALFGAILAVGVLCYVVKKFVRIN